MTETEILLWSRIRKKQILDFQFYRQKPIGNYIVDFYCPKAKLVLEVDGGQHYEEDNIQKDAKRDIYFKTLGIMVLRFTNIDIFQNMEGVLDEIYHYLSQIHP